MLLVHEQVVKCERMHVRVDLFKVGEVGHVRLECEVVSHHDEEHPLERVEDEGRVCRAELRVDLRDASRHRGEEQQLGGDRVAIEPPDSHCASQRAIGVGCAQLDKQLLINGVGWHRSLSLESIEGGVQLWPMPQQHEELGCEHLAALLEAERAQEVVSSRPLGAVPLQMGFLGVGEEGGTHCLEALFRLRAQRQRRRRRGSEAS